MTPEQLAEQREMWNAEHFRLRSVITEAADSLQAVVVPALTAICQHSTDENQDERMALLEVRNVVALLRANGRATREGDDEWR